jgi:flagellar basal body rod protein FlgG
MRSRLDQMDRLAADISNLNTAGYKGEVVADAEADRPAFDSMLQSAIDVTSGSRRLDTTAGPLASTGRDLDLSIEGKGFFVVQTPQGVRYTRNGSFARQTDGTLATADGSPVLGNDGKPITVPTGPVEVDSDGTLKVGGAVAGTLDLVEFSDPGRLTREGRSILRAPDDMSAVPAAHTAVRGGSLEQSNVSAADRIAVLTETMRTFETLQKAVSIQLNELDTKAIDVLGRRI